MSNSPIEPDDFQQAWRTQSSQTRVTVDPARLRSPAQWDQQLFRATIVLRDLREVGVAVALLVYWFWAGLTKPLPWTWWLTVPALLFVIGFILLDRRRHPQKATDPGQPLLKVVQDSLNQVDHQIWLLRNIFWWYLLPFTISISAFFIHDGWQSGRWEETLGLLLFLAVVYGVIYLVNQLTVRWSLQPRRSALQKQLNSLTDDTGEPLNEADVAS